MNGRYHGVGSQGSTGRLIAPRMQGFEAKNRLEVANLLRSIQPLGALSNALQLVSGLQ